MNEGKVITESHRIIPYTTNLGNYLSLIAAQEVKDESDLKSKVEIQPIYVKSSSFWKNPEKEARNLFWEQVKQYEFNNKQKYDAVVEIKKIPYRSGFCGLYSVYEITGLAVELNIDVKKKNRGS